MNVDAQWRADITRQMEASSKAQQDTALALERILGRLNAVERWQEDADDRRERQEERRDNRDDQRPNNRRADVAILIAGGNAALYLVSIIITLLVLVAAHWKP